MCDRQARRNIWRAGFDAGQRQAHATMGMTYQVRALDDLVGVLAGLMADHEASKPRPAGHRDAAGRWARVRELAP